MATASIVYKRLVSIIAVKTDNAVSRIIRYKPVSLSLAFYNHLPVCSIYRVRPAFVVLTNQGHTALENMLVLPYLQLIYHNYRQYQQPHSIGSEHFATVFIVTVTPRSRFQ